MIYLQLFGVFFKIGVLGFGGGYAMLSLIQFEIVERYAWLDASQFTEMIALSQMTPGPISINTATYAGYVVAGVIGSIVATFALVLPSLLMMALVIRFLLKNEENPIVKTTLSTLKLFIAGLILSASLLLMTPENFTDFGLDKNNISVIICALTFVGVYFFKINPILLIILSGVAGYWAF